MKAAVLFSAAQVFFIRKSSIPLSDHTLQWFGGNMQS